jgi:hypothetical protein
MDELEFSMAELTRRVEDLEQQLGSLNRRPSSPPPPPPPALIAQYVRASNNRGTNCSSQQAEARAACRRRDWPLPARAFVEEAVPPPLAETRCRS